MRKPPSVPMVRLESRCASVSQNGQAVRVNCHRVPQQPQDNSRRRPVSAPTSCAIAGSDPHVGQYLRPHRSSSRQAANASITGRSHLAMAVHARYRNSPWCSDVSVASAARASTTRAVRSGAPRRSLASARALVVSQPAASAGCASAGTTDDRPPHRHSRAAARQRRSPRGNRPTRGSQGAPRRAAPTHARPARRGPRPAGGRDVPPATTSGSHPQCRPSTGCGVGRTGNRRAARPKRKMVAAISPIEMPHSTTDGV